MYRSKHLERHLPWDGCLNIRDIGGYTTAAGEQTRWRALVRADNLCTLTPTGCEALRAYGVRTIIDLRQVIELAHAPHPFDRPAPSEHMPVYRNLAFEDWSNPTYQAAIRACTSMDQVYVVMLERDVSRVGAIVRAIAQAPVGGVLVHCAAGKDRTGLIVALLLSLVGVPDATIAEDYALSDRYLQPRYEEIMRTTRDEAERRRMAEPRKAPPERMLATLAGLRERYGDVRAYLGHAGVSAAELQQLGTRLLADD